MSGGAAPIVVLSVAEGKAGPEITSLLILRRAIVLVVPYFLAGMTLFWLLDRLRRRPS
jgi:hypothetical protein